MISVGEPPLGSLKLNKRPGRLLHDYTVNKNASLDFRFLPVQFKNFPVADPGEGPGGAAPLFLDQSEAQRAEKRIFFEAAPPPLSQGRDDRVPPLS